MPKTKTYRGWLVGVLLAGVLLMLQARQHRSRRIKVGSVAQDHRSAGSGQGQDPPSRVARMNFTQGSVSFQPGGEGDWVTAVPNRPLTTGDNLWADQGSRAEMHVGSTAIRLAPETSVTFLDLDDRTTQLRLSAGTVIVRVRHLDDGDVVEVDTPNLAFNLQHTGEYRVDVDSNGDMTNVQRLERPRRSHGWRIFLHRRGRPVGAFLRHRSVELRHRATAGAPMISTTGRFERDHREDGAESANYVSPEMTGYEDLDDYGHWQYVGGYGTGLGSGGRCRRIGLPTAMAIGRTSIPGAGPG